QAPPGWVGRTVFATPRRLFVGHLPLTECACNRIRTLSARRRQTVPVCSLLRGRRRTRKRLLHLSYIAESKKVDGSPAVGEDRSWPAIPERRWSRSSASSRGIGYCSCRRRRILP